jgi:hypothetical protein
MLSADVTSYTFRPDRHGCDLGIGLLGSEPNLVRMAPTLVLVDNLHRGIWM